LGHTQAPNHSSGHHQCSRNRLHVGFSIRCVSAPGGGDESPAAGALRRRCRNGDDRWTRMPREAGESRACEQTGFQPSTQCSQLRPDCLTEGSAVGSSPIRASGLRPRNPTDDAGPSGELLGRPRRRDRHLGVAYQRGSSVSGIVNLWLFPDRITRWRRPPLPISQEIEHSKKPCRSPSKMTFSRWTTASRAPTPGGMASRSRPRSRRMTAASSMARGAGCTDSSGGPHRRAGLQGIGCAKILDVHPRRRALPHVAVYCRARASKDDY